MTKREQRKCYLRPEWVQWWREMIRVLEDGGHAITEGRTVIYRVNKTSNTITLVHGTPEKSILDRRCIEACGYKYDVFPDPTAETTCKIEASDPKNPILVEATSGVLLIRRPKQNPPKL